MEIYACLHTFIHVHPYLSPYRLMSPSALIYLSGRERNEAKGLGGEGYPQSPINVRANKWLTEYDALNQNSIEGITPELLGPGYPGPGPGYLETGLKPMKKEVYIYIFVCMRKHIYIYI
jgi:hypothetical protein